jgi:ketosteroid isomerase-like protein
MDPRKFDAVADSLRNRGEEPTGSSGSALRTLEAQVEAIARGDFSRVLAQATDDVTLEIFAPPEFPFIRSARGSGAFQLAIERNFAAVTDQRPQIRDVFAEGEKIVLFGRETGTIQSSGVRYEVEFVERFIYREGRLAAVQIVVAHSRPGGD